MNRYLKNVDLSLLAALVLLVEKKNVTQSAQEMHMTQSAMSHVLNKLRNLLDDPILIRTDKGMAPTQKAMDVSREVAPLIVQLQKILVDQSDIVLEGKNEVVICSPEYFDLLILPKLRERCDSDITLVNDAAVSVAPVDELIDGRVKLMISFESHLSIPDVLNVEQVKSERLVCVVSTSHPILNSIKKKGKISVVEYLPLKHIDIYPFGFGFNLMDAWLDRNGMTREVSIKLPTYAAGMNLVESQQYAASIPLSVAVELSKKYDVKVLMLPKEVDETKVNLVWHPAHAQDKTLLWLRANIKNIISEFPSDQ